MDNSWKKGTVSNTLVVPDVAWLTEAATCDIPAWGFSVANASRAAVASFVKRAITRQAASCWYKACESSKSVIHYKTLVKLSIIKIAIKYTSMYI